MNPHCGRRCGANILVCGFTELSRSVFPCQPDYNPTASDCIWSRSFLGWGVNLRPTVNHPQPARAGGGTSTASSSAAVTGSDGSIWPSAPPRLLGLLLVLLACVAYLPAFHAGFIWDDDRYVTDNPLLMAPDGWWRIWFSLDAPSQYFPLTYSVFRLEYGLWGLVPAGYHWLNIFLHAMNALLVWQVLRRLAVPGAWLAAAIFVLHPVQVETVAWISELKNVLSLFFVLLAVLAWLEFTAEEARPRWRWYWVALAAQALALAAKSTACTLPVALWLVLWLRHRPAGWRRCVQLVPFLALGAAMGLLAMWWERFHQGTQGETFGMGVPQRFLVAGQAIWFYLGKLVWPVKLTFSYPRWTLNPGQPLAWGWWAAVALAGGVIFGLRRRLGRGPEVAALFFVLTLAPLLGFVMLFTFVYTFVADHYQYVACLGPIALAAAGIVWITSAVPRAARWLTPAVGGTLLLGLGMLTWRQCATYANSEVLWRATLQRNPDSWMARVNLGEYLARRGRREEAVRYWREAVQLNPQDVAASYDLGVADWQDGRAREAVEDFRQVLTLEPRFFKASNRLAWALATCPDPAVRNGPEAVRWAESANDFTKGQDADVMATLAAAYACGGQFSNAVAASRRSLELAPDDESFTNRVQQQLQSYLANSLFYDPQFTPAPAAR